MLGVVVPGWLWWCDRSSSGRPSQISGVTITKQPVVFANRTFDPANPPPEMPPLAEGEEAECDSNFLSNASVGGQVQQTDATHALVTISQINVTLQLNVSIWAPAYATPHVIEHEAGHRQISEHYYETAGELAQRIAGNYMGEKLEVSGTDLAGESNKLFQQVADEITDEYNKELNPEPAQLLYDNITDHGRSEVAVQDAIASAIKNVATQPFPRTATVPGN
jgi:hypothetical protein